MSVYFISGHLDLTEAEFTEHYVPRLERTKGDPYAFFVVGDADRGGDRLAQDWLLANGLWPKTQVFHMFEAPRYLAAKEDFAIMGGYRSDDARDAAMTGTSTTDIAWVRPGRERSGTQRNLDRRASARK